MLDRTQQRIVGVLIEKQLAVPDSYPMTLNALLAGCNQKSNRDPVMELEDFEIAGALMALQLEGWVIKVEGARADHYRHDVDQKLGLDERQKAVLAELLVRGPQAPGALKPRVARMGFHGGPDDVLAVLASLRERVGDPLAQLQPRRPRERDARWAHCLGDGTEVEASAEAAVEGDTLVPRPTSTAPPTPAPSTTATPAFSDDDFRALETRVAQLESELAQLREQLDALRGV